MLASLVAFHVAGDVGERGKGCARAVKCETNGLAAGFVLKGTSKALGWIG